MKPNIYLLDNFDSFTYNLLDIFEKLGYKVLVYRHDLKADYIFDLMIQETIQPILAISPGPGFPSQAGCLIELLSLCHERFPILGICLGFQGIIEYYGGKINIADHIMHGKASVACHNGDVIFEGIPKYFNIGRYHSLIGDDLPDCLKINCFVNSYPMGIKHATKPIVGFQFHPESVLTTYGSKLLKNTLHYLEHYYEQ